MAVIINGDTGIDKITDGSVVQADLASGITVDSLSTASGSAPSYSARAWVNFNGTGTVAIRSSGNVSSITDNGTGDYTVNFTTAMPDTNYCSLGTSNGVVGAAVTVVEFDIGGGSVSSIGLNTSVSGGGGDDRAEVYCAFFR